MNLTLSPADILFFVEDPGAANYLVHLPRILTDKGYSCSVIATGNATDFFKKQSVPFTNPSSALTADEILGAVSPRLLLIGISENPESLGLFLTSEGKKRGITTIGAVDTSMNAGYCYRGKTSDPLNYAPDLLMVPDEWDKDAFVSLGFPPNRVFVCGHPQYDFVRSEGLRLERIGRERVRSKLFHIGKKSKKVVLFASEKSAGLNPSQFNKNDSYNIQGRGTSNTRTRIVIEEFLDAVSLLNERPFLMLRLSPKERLEELSDYLNEFDYISRNEPVMEVLFAADCVVGMTSMIMVEAVIIGRPTFSILPRDIERQWLPTIRADFTECATTREEIRSRLPLFINRSPSFNRRCSEGLFVFGAIDRASSVIVDAFRSFS